MILDTRTIVLSYIATDIACLAVMVLLWRQNRERISGTHLWVIYYIVSLFALILMILRGAIPDGASVILVNALFMAGTLIGYQALLRFAGEIRRQTFNYFILAAAILIHAYFPFGKPDVNARIFNLSAVLLVFFSQCAWFCLRGAPEAQRKLMWWPGLVFVLHILVSLCRMAAAVFAPHAQADLFQQNTTIALSVIAYQLLFVALTFALALMYNQRLVEEVRANEEKFELAFQSAPYTLVLSRLSDGKILAINDSFTRITGYSEADIRGKTAADLKLWVNEEDRAIVVRDLRETGAVFERKLLFRKKSGEIMTGLLSAKWITIQDEKCLLFSVNDVTEREKVLEELRTAQEQWQKTFDSTQDAIWLMDRNHNILRSNKAAQRLFDRPAENMTDRHCWEVVHGTSAPTPECPILLARESLRRESMDLSIAGKWYLVTVDPILDKEERFAGAVHTMTDISERRQAQEEINHLNETLEQKIADQTRDLRDSQAALLNLVDDLNENAKNLTMINDSLEEVNRELASFSYSVSHDLRAPLRTIDGFSNALMEDYSDRLDAEGNKYLERIHHATQQMNRLIDDLLGLSRVMKSDFYRQDFNLSEVVREICADFHQQPSEGRPDLVIQDGIAVNADQRMMRIVMTNLLDNARKFAGKKERPILEFGSFVENGETVFFVRDNGVGFNMTYAQRVFEPFERLHRADEFPGTGIGLATVARVISRHRGRIWAEAQEGKGATFYFTLGA